MKQGVERDNSPPHAKICMLLITFLLLKCRVRGSCVAFTHQIIIFVVVVVERSFCLLNLIFNGGFSSVIGAQQALIRIIPISSQISSHLSKDRVLQNCMRSDQVLLQKGTWQNKKGKEKEKKIKLLQL